MSGLEQVSEELESEESTEEIQEELELEEKPKLSADEEKALNDGWMPKEDWESKGNDIDDWVSAKKFNERGELIGTLKATRKKVEEMERNFDDRLKANKKLHDIQTKAMLADLERRRDEAVETANVEEFKKTQSQIDDLNRENTDETPASTNTDQQIIDDYNKNNSWLYDGSPKAAYATQQFIKYNSSGMGAQEAINAMESDIKREFPDINPNRDTPSTTEKNRSRPNRPRNNSIKWSDLTKEELKWFEFGDFKSKDEYLKIVEDDRKSRG